MRNAKESDVWSVIIQSASGGRPVAIYRGTRATVEAAVIGFLFDTDEGVGLGGTAQPDGYPRVCVWNES